MTFRTIAVGLLIATASLAAQPARTFKARLAPVPIDVAMQATVAGRGAVTATLNGTKLTIAGHFEGLKSSATIAQLHRSTVAGVRGPVAFELAATKSTSGTIVGSVDLAPGQITDLEKGRLYVQLHSEKAPEGNLWGWLFPQEIKR